MKLLNVGCGSTYHPTWINIDIVSTSPEVIGYDLRKGLPFPDDYFDVVYHSHVLEHLTASEGEGFLREGLRVLKKGGIIRVVVPDLEQIIRIYLEKFESALAGDAAAQHDYNWMMIELYDQCCRTTPGGKMWQYLKQVNIPNLPFIESRIGSELDNLLQSRNNPRPSLIKKIFSKKPIQIFNQLRLKAAFLIVYAISGKKNYQRFAESVFRNSGEIHQWMYDRYSLTSLLSHLNVENIQVCSHFKSQIPNFSDYQLDITVNGQARKPDSLFIEGFKR